MEFTKIKILILEDDEAYARVLSLFLNEIGIINIKTASSYEEGVAIFKSFQPTICLLDIELGENKKNGIEFASFIRKSDQDIPIIYLTSHFHNSIYEEARKTQPTSFMNKELSKLKVQQAVELTTLQLDLKQNNVAQEEYHLHDQNEVEGDFSNNNILFFKIGDSYKAINVKEVKFFFTEKRMTYARVEERNYPTSARLRDLEKTFYPKFIRCHKKFLVNIDAIDSIILKKNEIIIGKETISIGSTYRKVLVKRLNLLK